MHTFTYRTNWRRIWRKRDWVWPSGGTAVSSPVGVLEGPARYSWYVVDVRQVLSLQAADIERLRQDRPGLPSLRAVLPAFPLVDWEAQAGNSKPRSALQREWADRKEWDIIKSIFDQPVSCSDPYPADVL